MGTDVRTSKICISYIQIQVGACLGVYFEFVFRVTEHRTQVLLRCKSVFLSVFLGAIGYRFRVKNRGSFMSRIKGGDFRLTMCRSGIYCVTGCLSGGCAG